MVLRGAKRKGVRYFGPYAHAYAIRETLDLLLRTFPIRTCTKGKFDRHQRLGRPCLYAHIEKCAAPCVGAVDPRGVRRPRRRADPVPRRRHRPDPRPARQADARGERRARVRARGAPPRPDRVGAQGDRAPADGRRQGGGLRRHRDRRRPARGVGAGVPRAQGPGRRPQGPRSSTRSRTSTDAELVGRLLEQLYGGARRRRHPARGPRAGRCPRTSSSTRSSSRPQRGAQGAASACRSAAPSASCCRRSTQNARRGVRAPQAASGRPTTTRAARALLALQEALAPARSAAAHRVLRHLEPPGHRDRRRRWW